MRVMKEKAQRRLKGVKLRGPTTGTKYGKALFGFGGNPKEIFSITFKIMVGYDVYVSKITKASSSNSRAHE